MSNCNCDNSNCGPSREPCDSSLPETCDPLEQTTSGVRVVVEDENACKRGLISDEESAILLYDANGEVIWRDGSSAQPIYLPSIQTVREEVEGVIVSDNGTIKSLQGTLAAAETEVLTHNGTDFILQERSAIFGSGDGVLVRNSGTNLAGWVAGTEGQVLTINSSGDPEFTDPKVSDVTGFIDLDGLRIQRTSSTTMTLIVSSLAVKEYNGTGILAVSGLSNFVIDISTTGVNALDSGTITGYDLWWVYVIYNPTTGTAAGLLSGVPSQPSVMPTGYTYYRRVGAMRRSGSTIPDGYIQNRNIMRFGVAADIEVNRRTGAVNTFGALSLTSTHVPSAEYATKVIWKMAIWGSAQGVRYNASVANTATADVDASIYQAYGGSSMIVSNADETEFCSFDSIVPVTGNQIARTNAYNMTSYDDCGLWISGYELAL